jgi:uncharacterized membrane protein
VRIPVVAEFTSVVHLDDAGKILTVRSFGSEAEAIDGLAA